MFGWLLFQRQIHSMRPLQKEWNAYRIKHLIPDYGHEICSKFHPLAVGLEDLVHPAKGCYIGQEVLARMVSRKKARKKTHSRKQRIT